MAIRLAAALLCIVALCGVAAAQPAPPVEGERRVALVIGNGAYVDGGLPRLRNPANDAEDVAAALRRLGFGVVVGVDLTRREMDLLLVRFNRLARRADVALVYYAGHGLQHDGLNYLVPVDVAIEDAASLRLAPTAQSILADLRHERGPMQGVRVLILDACRDNAVVTRLGPATRGGPLTRGLSRMPDAMGMLIAYAAQPNAVARDGTTRNSPFTTAFLRHVETPGLDLRLLFTRVRGDVVQATDSRQWPEVVDGLIGEFVLRPAALTATPPARPPQAEPAAVARPAVPPPIAVLPERPRGFLTQVSVSLSEEDARQRVVTMQTRFPQIFTGRPMYIHRAELPGRGIYFRVGASGFASRETASEFCTALRAAGGDCFVIGN